MREAQYVCVQKKVPTQDHWMLEFWFLHHLFVLHFLVERLERLVVAYGQTVRGCSELNSGV